MIITIDGPAASGKSTVAQLIAQKLDCYYLNSGLLYRALAYIIHDQGMQSEDYAQVSQGALLDMLDPTCFSYCYTYGSVAIIYKQQDITTYLKSATIDHLASALSSLKEVRAALLEYQRAFARDHCLVTDGRDCGTVVFPQADYKFFLTASVEVRAMRWQKEQAHKGIALSLQESKQSILTRDHRDMTRVLSPLMAAPDAYSIDNSYLTQEQTAAVLFEYIQSQQKAGEHI